MRSSKKILNRNSLIIIAIIYIASWLVPIEISFNDTNGFMGYEGAELANEILTEGLVYFKNIFTGKATINLDGFIKHLYKIVVGLSNILFIAAFILVATSNKFSLHFIAPCVLTMLLWGGGELIIGGYLLWVLAGIWLSFISLSAYKETVNKSNAAILISAPLIITYSIGVLAIVLGFLS